MHGCQRYSIDAGSSTLKDVADVVFSHLSKVADGLGTLKAAKFVSLGAPDAGAECYCILPDDNVSRPEKS